MSRILFNTLSTFIFIVIISNAAATAQTDGARTTRTPPRSESVRNASPQTSAEEDFELNIVERRINEGDYEASTAVEANDVGGAGLSLRVGAMLRAAEIDVLLRNVRGRVRFRGNLELLLRRLGLGPPTTPQPNPSP